MLPRTRASRRATTAVAPLLATAAMAVILLAGPGFASLPTVVLLVVAYGGFLAAVAGPATIDRRLVIGLGSTLLVLAVVRPPMQSHDLWSYVMYGRTVSQHQASPYTHPPATFHADPFLARVDPLWRHTRSVYGPLFTAASAVFTRVAGSSALVARLGFQLAAACAVALAALLVHRRTRGDPRALALVLLNPLVIFSLVNDAHLDVFVGVAVLGAVLLVERRRGWAAGLLLGAAILIKAIALLPAGALGIWLLTRRDRRALVVPLAAALVTVVLAGYAVGGGRTAIQPVLDSSTHLSGASVWTPLVRAEIDDEEREGNSPEAARTEVGRKISHVATLVVLGLTVALALAWRRDDDALAVAGGAVLVFTLGAAYVYPWYLAGGVFALAARRRSPLTWLLVGSGLLLQLATVPGRQFTTFVHRQQRLPDPVWHQWLRNWGAPGLELVLVGVLLVVMGRKVLAART